MTRAKLTAQRAAAWAAEKAAWRAYKAAKEKRKALDERIANLPPDVIEHVDKAGRAFITREEGKRNEPYDDSREFATTGVGHLIARRSIHTLSQSELERWTLTDAEVDELLSKDLAHYEMAVRAVFAGAKLKANQHMFNACTSLALNIGADAFKGSTVARKIREGNKRGAADAFLMWKQAGNDPDILLPRRQRERALFLS